VTVKPRKEVDMCNKLLLLWLHVLSKKFSYYMSS